MTASDHYARHLADYYAWLVGGVAAARGRASAELDALGATGPGRALDLGAGFGAHAIPLVQRGYSVVAVDSSRPLLDAISADAPEVHTIESELLEAFDRVGSDFTRVLCMGDTLTHLATLDEVESLLTSSLNVLGAGGRFVTTFRNYLELPAEPRFFTVRSSADRIATCGIEAHAERVRVHDVLHERDADEWTARSSSYWKLRLDPEWVEERLRSRATVRRYDAPSGMVGIEAEVL